MQEQKKSDNIHLEQTYLLQVSYLSHTAITDVVTDTMYG